MKLEIVSPTELVLSGFSEEQISSAKSVLTYTNKSAQFQLTKFKHNAWFASKYGEEAYQEKLQEMKNETKVCLLKEAPDGTFRTYSGLGGLLSRTFHIPVENSVCFPKPTPIGWNVPPPFSMYFYQKEALDALLAAKHAGVEIGTGLGKSLIISHLTLELGLKTIVMAPSSQIAEQLFESFIDLFGKKRVGKCFGKTKDYKKLITVCLPQTLINFKPGSPQYDTLSKTQVFIADESHTLPAKTLADVCFGLIKDAPYRFFFSATQMRNDGADKLLDGIVGPIVYKKTVREGVDEGFLAKPVFKMIQVESNDQFFSTDANAMTRKHLYYNSDVIKKAASLANGFLQYFDHKVLILIEEVEQFTKLYPNLKFSPGFAHGPLGENRAKVPKDFWESDPNALVKEFNEGDLKLLIGTSCISTGTDIRPVNTIIYLMGGKSEIQVKQAIGRATRKTATKNVCNFIDFDIINIPMIHKHAVARKEIYNEVYGPVTYMDS